MSLTGNNAIVGSGFAGNQPFSIDQSLRFDGSGYLARSLGSDVAITQATISFWIKRAAIDTTRLQIFDFGAESGDANEFDVLRIKESGTGEDSLVLFNHDDGVDKFSFETSQVFRDPSAWYNICLVYDTGNATEAQRLKLFVNGEQVTSFTAITYPTQNDPLFLSSRAQTIGANYAGSYDGNYYLAEFHYIEGSSLTPASFGETDSSTNQWVGKYYNGSYGTNGFYLKFQDSSALGADSSGNGNNFTATNLAATDQVLDSPMNNFSTLNPLDALGNNNTFSEGNLKCVVAAQNTNEETRSTIGVSSGKWYWEFYLVSTTTTAGYFKVGLKSPDESNFWNVRGSDGELDHNGSTGTSSVSYTTTNIVNVAVDMDSGKWWVGTNGTWVGDPSAGSGELHSGISGTVLPYILNAGSGGTHTIVSNFGQDSSFAGNKTAQGNGGVLARTSITRHLQDTKR